MIIWIDAQISPAIAIWIEHIFGIETKSLRELGLRDAEDSDIFLAAKKSKAVIITKDADFVALIDRFGSPPQVIWLTCGNTSNAKLKQILSALLPDAVALLESGESLVEISDF